MVHGSKWFSEREYPYLTLNETHIEPTDYSAIRMEIYQHVCSKQIEFRQIDPGNARTQPFGKGGGQGNSGCQQDHEIKRYGSPAIRTNSQTRRHHSIRRGISKY